MNNYIVYHLHTEQSLLDSCTNYKDYINKAKELGQKAIAFTEHGNTYCWVEKKMACDEAGIKYIHGVEIYLTEKLFWEPDEDHPELYNNEVPTKSHNSGRPKFHKRRGKWIPSNRTDRW